MRRSFSWENFTTRFIKSILYSERTRKELRPKNDIEDIILLLPYMDRIATFPDEKFIRHYRSEIMDYFFADSVNLVSIIKAFERKNYHGVHIGSMDEMLFQLKQLKLTSTVLSLIMSELYKKGRKIDVDEEYSIFSYPKTIDLKEQDPVELPLYDFQKQAVNKLKSFFVEENKKAGILVMPTGSGKTRVATRFLLQELVGRGYQVLWLTHRDMLVEQTADSIYKAASIIKFEDINKDIFKMVCVSGQHATVRALENNDDVMIFSVQTLCRNMPFLQAVLKDKIMIIVDEAHHTLAPSYQLIIDKIHDLRPDSLLLGLTATPVRISNEGTAHLMKIFDNNIVFNIRMSELIAKGVLAIPKYIPIDTNIDLDTTITLDDKAYIQKWGELSPVLVDRIAQTAERNELIVNTYMSRREEFGKTLIFALNAIHCISLCEELKKKGVRCDYIYSAHPGNDEKINHFKNGTLDVLVNINILTEGSDVPDIQTVFLTRPTSSDVLLMQMIGRGMRGIDCGGTEIVNIVDFHDIWGSFTKWMNPEFLFDETNAETEIPNVVKKSMNRSDFVPWGMIRDLLDNIHISMSEMGYADAVLPTGWYDVVDEDGNDMKILVFESQLFGYKAMWNDKVKWKEDGLFDGEKALTKFFSGFGWMPSAYELKCLIDFYRLSGQMPHLYPLKDRKKVEAYIIAKQLKDTNARLQDIEARTSHIYKENKYIIDSIYGGYEAYTERVNDFIRYPDGNRPLGSKIEEMPYEFLTLDRNPIYDLHELVLEVINEMFEGSYPDRPPVNWTEQPYTSYFGQYRYPKEGFPGKDFIIINSLLNSKDVPRETVKYIIYHELLHKGHHKHDKEFRMLEHKYPNYTEHEHFLDFTFPKFDLKYAL